MWWLLAALGVGGVAAYEHSRNKAALATAKVATPPAAATSAALVELAPKDGAIPKRGATGTNTVANELIQKTNGIAGAVVGGVLGFYGGSAGRALGQRLGPVLNKAGIQQTVAIGQGLGAVGKDLGKSAYATVKASISLNPLKTTVAVTKIGAHAAEAVTKDVGHAAKTFVKSLKFW